MAFLRNLLATLLGLAIFSIFSVVIFFLIIGAIASSGDEVPVVKSNSVLYLNLNGALQERALEDPLQELLFENNPGPIGLKNTLDVLDAARTDERIKGIYLESNFLQGGYASMREIRNALKTFKESGKFVYAYGTYLTEGDYYIVSVADSLFLNPEGSLELNGLSSNITFFKGAFDKLGVEPQIFRVGKYKSYVEPYIRKDMSKENEYQLRTLLNSVYDEYTTGVSESVEASKDEIRNISDQMLIRLPEDAVKYGLVHRLAYEDEIRSLIRSQIELEEDDDINFIKLTDYYKNAGSRYNLSGDQIAVIVAEGDIIMGNGSTEIAGSRFVKELKKARLDDKIKAVVLRVNSPGGSLTASDMIWREVTLLKKVKPVIASMGDVAASGGYYISMPCDEIVAQPNTITGSIGIFGMMFDLSNMLEDKLGITHDVVKTGEYSDIMTVTRPLSEKEKMIIQAGVEKGYDTFISKAAEGRDMTVDEIKNLASGRVWTGKQALENGLIDRLGGLDDAIKRAAEKAELEIDEVAVRYYPEQKPFLELLFDNSKADIRSYVADEAYGQLSPFIKKMKKLQNYQGIQARLPYELEIN
ncbi:MAG: signal peptide peptidase SppA [Cyclobacteriaceae bacterium]